MTFQIYQYFPFLEDSARSINQFLTKLIEEMIVVNRQKEKFIEIMRFNKLYAINQELIDLTN